ncbi:hypothetical protein EB796_004978 [Bugula neritina]|uniref:Uncharacterized protein n=1 Tax=Bugula neritina TaxID=10212 RepID=A0A7J7KGU0_BUGNE|nr:hypothetical protein EB796_004978 [Bugula neritina]
MITLHDVERRRSRKDGQHDADFHVHSYKYTLKLSRDECIQSVQICYKAFMAIFGITITRLKTIKKALSITGKPPVDGRGKHGNVANKLPEQTKEMIRQHIKSFRGERSHYSLGKSKRLYLPAELNQTKMFELFKEKHPDIKVSQETYRQIFINEFNISFGYPRSDTCSTCDENRAIVEQLKLVLKDDQDNEDVKEQLSKAEIENKVHLARAKQFYNHKRNARRSAEVDDSIMAICMDFQKKFTFTEHHNKRCVLQAPTHLHLL